MKDPMSRGIMQRNYLFFLFMHGIIEMVKFSNAKSQDQTLKVPPVSTSLLCFSDCATCPVICSPPPAPPANLPHLPQINLSPPEPYYYDQQPPLPPINLSPPERYYIDQPPPLPPIILSPPEPYYFDQPPPFLPAFPPPAPSSYVPWTETPYAVSPPAPPNNVAGQGSPGAGTGQQRSFTFPYYYYNLSQGSCISSQFAFLFHVIVCLTMFLNV